MTQMIYLCPTRESEQMAPIFWRVGYLRHQRQVDLWPFDLETGVRVTCDVGYLCASFSLPRPPCSRVRPDVPDRQTSDRQTSGIKQKHRLMPPPYRGGGTITQPKRIPS